MPKGVTSISKQCPRCGDNFIATNPSIIFCCKDCHFWHNVEIKTETECWEWKGSRRKGGYGRFFNGVASRYAWEAVNGKMPNDLFACHKCDNPPCCNPKHIWAGTPKQNTVDCIEKERRVGEITGRSVLKVDDVKQIVIRIQNGEDAREIAKSYGVAFSNIYRIKNGKSWAHITKGPVLIPETIKLRNEKINNEKRGESISLAMRKKNNVA